MPIEELWSSAHQASLDALSASLQRDDLCGALLAIEGAEEAQEAATRAILSVLSSQVASLLPQNATPEAQASALAIVLSSEGFDGAREDYLAPQNSFLTQVLERRRGLPILLSAIWILIGRGAGIDVDGVGLPGHFIARVGGMEGTLVDPFSGGEPISRAACQRIVSKLSGEKLAWREEFLASTPLDELIERVLRNLVNSHAARSDAPALYRTAKLWSGLRPEDPEPLLSVGLFAERLGAPSLAREAFTSLLARFGDSSEAGVAREHLARIAARGRAN